MDREAMKSDARIERMDRVAALFGEITAATREFLAALAQSDRHRDWEDEGFGSCAEWLAWRIGIMLEDGTRVSAETARRLSCDASRVEVHHDVDGSVLDVGRKTRTIPPALRRALDARDRGCRFPGCGLRFTDAHHIKHWADGGDTKLENTLLLCRHHHRRVHEGGYQVCSDRHGRIVFFTPRGKALFEAPPLPELSPDPVGVLVRGNRERGVTPDGRSVAFRWKRDRDIPWSIEAAAIEALDPWGESPVGTARVENVRVGKVRVGKSSAQPSPSTGVSAEIA